MTRVIVGTGDRIDLQVDQQHISRITHSEAELLVTQLLIFAGREFREKIHNWLNDGKIGQIAEVIAPESVEAVQISTERRHALATTTRSARLTPPGGAALHWFQGKEK